MKSTEACAVGLALMGTFLVVTHAASALAAPFSASAVDSAMVPRGNVLFAMLGPALTGVALGFALLIARWRIARFLFPAADERPGTEARLPDVVFGVLGVYFAVSGASTLAGQFTSQGPAAAAIDNPWFVNAAVELVLGIVIAVGSRRLAHWTARLRGFGLPE